MSRHSVLVPLLGTLLAACGGASVNVGEPTVPEVPTEAETEVVETTEPVAEEAVAAEPVPETPNAKQPEPEPQPPAERKIELVSTTASGRPIVQYVEANGVTTTLGRDGGILKIGDASLRIPENALREGMNVTFALAPKVKGPAGAIGPVYKVAPETRTVGAAFQLVLPVPAGVSSAAFAVETTTGEKSAKAKASWQTIPATKIFTDRDPNVALLELDSLFEGHVTLVPASAEKN